MIYLLTGLPGNGKTFLTVKLAPELLAHPGRTIYHNGIPDLKLPWVECDAAHWYNLPDGSGVVIDEAQKIFRPLPPGVERPRAVRDLETHRHRGFDLWLITQDAGLIDSHVRRLVGKHFHVHRPFGMARFNVWAWEEVSDPKDYHAKQRAVKSHHKLEQKYFDLYKSAEIHTVKRRLPWKLFLIPLAALAILMMAYLAYRTFTKDPLKEKPNAAKVNALTPLGATASASAAPRTPLQAIIPAIPNLAHTAPRYDALTGPKAVPVVRGCMADHRTDTPTCWCVSQRGTRMDVAPEFCMSVIVKGRPFYDFEDEDGQSLHRAGNVTRAPSSATEYQRPQFPHDKEKAPPLLQSLGG